MYLALLNALGIGADEAVPLEDSAHGAASAKAAGLFCVVVPNKVTGRLLPPSADRHADSLEIVSISQLERAFAGEKS